MWRYSRCLKKVIQGQGWQLAKSEDDADVVIFFAYGIGDPQQHTYSYSVPVSRCTFQLPPTITVLGTLPESIQLKNVAHEIRRIGWTSGGFRTRGELSSSFRIASSFFRYSPLSCQFFFNTEVFFCGTATGVPQGFPLFHRIIPLVR